MIQKTKTKRKQKGKQDINNILKHFSKTMGKPIVVTFKVTRNNINFISCLDYQIYLGNVYEEEPTPKDTTPQTEADYIG